MKRHLPYTQQRQFELQNHRAGKPPLADGKAKTRKVRARPGGRGRRKGPAQRAPASRTHGRTFPAGQRREPRVFPRGREGAAREGAGRRHANQLLAANRRPSRAEGRGAPRG